MGWLETLPAEIATAQEEVTQHETALARSLPPDTKKERLQVVEEAVQTCIPILTALSQDLVEQGYEGLTGQPIVQYFYADFKAAIERETGLNNLDQSWSRTYGLYASFGKLCSIYVVPIQEGGQLHLDCMVRLHVGRHLYHPIIEVTEPTDPALIKEALQDLLKMALVVKAVPREIYALKTYQIRGPITQGA